MISRIQVFGDKVWNLSVLRFHNANDHITSSNTSKMLGTILRTSMTAQSRKQFQQIHHTNFRTGSQLQPSRDKVQGNIFADCWKSTKNVTTCQASTSSKSLDVSTIFIKTGAGPRAITVERQAFKLYVIQLCERKWAIPFISLNGCPANWAPRVCRLRTHVVMRISRNMWPHNKR